MRIAQIVPGSGLPYYCENCARDGSLAAALRDRGHEVAAGALYLPPGFGPPGAPIFYGAVNLYLGHRFPRYRGAPAWLRQVLDSRGVLRLAGRFSGTTDASGMEGLTLSMLRGEEGGQAEELSRLVCWLQEVRPDAVHLSNCLLTGVARRLRRELGVPVACSLQDEDTWIEAMGGQARAAAWRILAENAAHVDVFTAASSYYAGFMAERMAIPPGRVRVVPIGIDVEGFAPSPSGLPSEPPVIGYLSRLSERMGAGLLADSFSALARGSRFPGLRLRLAGGGTRVDAAFVRALRRTLAGRGLLARVDFVRGFAREDRVRFLRSLTVLSVPVQGGEAFGTFLLEAMASGVPVVQPRVGGFTELVEQTGGGVLYEPNTPESLAAALEGVLADTEHAAALGRAGRNAVLTRYTAAHMAAALECALADARTVRRGGS